MSCDQVYANDQSDQLGIQVITWPLLQSSAVLKLDQKALTHPDIPQGPAVWALRAQTDKQEYAVLMRRLLEATPNLHLREGQAVGLDLGPNDEVPWPCTRPVPLARN